MDAEEPTARTPLLPAALADDVPAAATGKHQDSQQRPLEKLGRRFDLTDAVVPPLVMGYIAVVYWTACTLISPELGQWRLPYLAAAHTLLPALLYVYLTIYTLPASSAAPPRAPPPAVVARTVPFVCADNSDDVPRCRKDACAGSWKPERTRHCSICRSCQVGFDHHCPWFGTCITSESYLPFLLFLALVPPTVLLLGSPIARPVVAHLRRVWAFARTQDGPVWRAWFGWGWSWLLGIGPIGRAGVGLVMGYWRWEGEVGPLERGWLAVLLFVGVGVSLIAVGLAGATLRSILISVTPIEGRILGTYNRTDPRLRSAYLAAPPDESGKPLLVDPRVWVWVPSAEQDGTGVALRTRVDEKPFDLGWAGNLRAVLEDGWAARRVLPWSAPETRQPALRLNPAVWKRLAYEASLLASKEESDEEAEEESESEAGGAA